MLTNRLTGTTEATAGSATNTRSCTQHPTAHESGIFPHPPSAREAAAPLLTRANAIDRIEVLYLSASRLNLTQVPDKVNAQFHGWSVPFLAASPG
jgi:hypothetical protein